MKAWRNIKGNNGERPVVSRTTIKGSTWLLDGLLIRAGIIDPLPTLPRSFSQSYDYAGEEGWLKRFQRGVKKLLA